MDLNAQGFGHMFPYSNIHELNLDWLIAKVKELEERVTDLERRMAEAEARLDDHEQRITWLEAEFARLREEWEAFKAYIEDRFDQLEAEIRELFAELEARIDAKFEQLKHQLEDRFTALESELKSQVQEILQYIIDTCAEFTDKVTRLTVRVENLEAGMEECCLTISGKLDEVLAALDEVNPELRELVVTQNGEYLASDEGATGYYKVVVNVEGSGAVQAVLEALTITANGTYTPPAGVDGYNEIIVDVPPVSDRVAEAKTITANGTTNTPAGKYYDPITVNVPQTTVQSLTDSVTAGTSAMQYTKTAPTGQAYSPVNITVNPTPTEEKTVTQNGTVTPSSGKHLSKVTVQVPQTTVQSLTDSVTAGTSAMQYTKTAPTGQAYSPVNITVNPTPTEEKTVTQNGTVTPSSGKHLSKVTVQVPRLVLSDTGSVEKKPDIVNQVYTIPYNSESKKIFTIDESYYPPNSGYFIPVLVFNVNDLASRVPVNSAGVMGGISLQITNAKITFSYMSLFESLPDRVIKISNGATAFYPGTTTDAGEYINLPVNRQSSPQDDFAGSAYWESLLTYAGTVVPMEYAQDVANVRFQATIEAYNLRPTGDGNTVNKINVKCFVKFICIGSSWQ